MCVCSGERGIIMYRFIWDVISDIYDIGNGDLVTHIWILEMGE